MVQLVRYLGAKGANFWGQWGKRVVHVVQVERVVKCQLAPYQMELCRILEAGVSAGGLPGVSIHNPVMELRNICNHPYLSRLHVEVHPPF